MTISAWQLLWIVPLSMLAGFFFAALCTAAAKEDRHERRDDL